MLATALGLLFQARATWPQESGCALRPDRAGRPAQHHSRMTGPRPPGRADPKRDIARDRAAAELADRAVEREQGQAYGERHRDDRDDRQWPKQCSDSHARRTRDRWQLFECRQPRHRSRMCSGRLSRWDSVRSSSKRCDSLAGSAAPAAWTAREPDRFPAGLSPRVSSAPAACALSFELTAKPGEKLILAAIRPRAGRLLQEVVEAGVPVEVDDGRGNILIARGGLDARKDQPELSGRRAPALEAASERDHERHGNQCQDRRSINPIKELGVTHNHVHGRLFYFNAVR